MKGSTIYLAVIGILILIIIYLRSCTGKCPETITTVKTDTQYITIHDTSIVYQPQPYAVNGKSIKVPVYFTDTVQTTVVIPSHVDTPAIMEKYYNVYYYSDTNYKYSDTMRKKYGYVVVRDQVSENRITRRYWEDHLISTTVTNTITQTINRAQLYAGIAMYGNRTQLLNGIGGNLLLKTKRNQIYQVGAFVGPGGIINYTFGMDFLIKLKK